MRLVLQEVKVTLIFEIAAGIVLGVVLLYLGSLCLVLAASFFQWVASWSTAAKLISAIVIAVLLIAAYNTVFPPETRAHFAARYKKAHPEYANTPDEELVKRVLDAYPELCSKVEGGCPR